MQNFYNYGIYVLYDREHEEVFCCIELDGAEHKTDSTRIQRDKIIDEMFKDNIKLIRQEIKPIYNKNDIIDKIIN